MRKTNTTGVDELSKFAQTFLNVDEAEARMQVEDEFFPECEPLLTFKRVDYQDSEAELDKMLVAFLDSHKLTECQITGPDY
jgi:hypothetical protein